MQIRQRQRRRLRVALLGHVSAARTARRRRLLRHLQARAAWVEQARLAPSMATLTELAGRRGSTPLDESPVPRRKRGPGRLLQRAGAVQRETPSPRGQRASPS